jgi:hypothetical protein
VRREAVGDLVDLGHEIGGQTVVPFARCAPAKVGVHVLGALLSSADCREALPNADLLELAVGQGDLEVLEHAPKEHAMVGG